jgi:glyoxylase-like metal-dependent hydrolase (beta-lactamase superfamily II)
MTKLIFTICSLLVPVVFSAQSNTYDIYAIKFGERNHYVKMKDVAVGDISNDSTKVFFMYWLLKGTNGKTILVDAGFTQDAGINPKFITFTAPYKLLSATGTKPEEVTDIIITHPHWDHVGGIDLYPNAMVWMQEEDYSNFISEKKDPESSGFNIKDIKKVRDRKARGGLTLIKGDDKAILPGIKVFTGSKHTAGAQFVLLNNGIQDVIIASDNSWFYYNLLNLLPVPITLDQEAYTRNLARMRQYVKDPDLIIPGHDPLVFTKFKTVAADVVQIKK